MASISRPSAPGPRVRCCAPSAVRGAALALRSPRPHAQLSEQPQRMDGTPPEPCRPRRSAVPLDAPLEWRAGLGSIETLKTPISGRYRVSASSQRVFLELENEFQIDTAQRNSMVARQRLWPWSRTTAWRRVKQLMAAAGITGACATPKGLRHAFGVTAFQTKVPPHLVQRWLGHASLRTTAIYGDVFGHEERLIAARMWRAG